MTTMKLNFGTKEKKTEIKKRKVEIDNKRK